MDFLKKFFGKKDESEAGGDSSQGGGSSMGAGAPAGGGLNESQGSGEKKQDHDSGHPSGQAGKNVCEFC